MRAKVLAGLGVAIVVMATALLVLDSDDTATVAARGTTTTTAADTTTTTPTTTKGYVELPTSTTTTTAAPTTTTTVCHNSTDPACGPFRWDPAPFPNQPLAVRVMRDPQDAVAGEPTTWRVEGEDADAQVVWCQAYDMGDGTTMGTVGSFCSGGPGCAGRRFGPWSPPARKAGAYTYEVTHTYERPGTYTARFFVFSEDGGECHPYGNHETVSVTVEVSPRPLVP